MAELPSKEAQEHPVGHAMIGDTLTVPILQCDLFEELKHLHEEEAWLQKTAPSSKTLVKHPNLRIVLVAMREKVCMSEHQTGATISVQTLAGCVRLRLPNRTVELPAGQLLVLDHDIPHDVEATQDSAFLLTLSSPSPEGLKGVPDGS